MTGESAAGVLVIGGDADDVARIRAVLLDTGWRGVFARFAEPPSGDRESAEPAFEGPTRVVELALLVRPDPDTVVAQVRAWADRMAALRLVVLADDPDDDDLVLHAFAAGADGWFPTRADGPDLARSVRAVLAGETLVSPRHLAALVRTVRVAAREPLHLTDGRVVDLTQREHDILVDLARGAATEEIAARMSLSEPSVRWHTARVLRRAGISSPVPPGGPVHRSTVAPAAERATSLLSARRVLDAGCGPDRGPDALPVQRGAAPEDAPAAPSRSGRGLTPAELLVARLAALGRTDKRIAAELVMSRHSVAAHLKAAAGKLAVRTRSELARAVLQEQPGETGPPARPAIEASGRHRRGSAD